MMELLQTAYEAFIFGATSSYEALISSIITAYNFFIDGKHYEWMFSGVAVVLMSWLFTLERSKGKFEQECNSLNAAAKKISKIANKARKRAEEIKETSSSWGTGDIPTNGRITP